MIKNEEILEVFNKRYACKKFSTEKRVAEEDLKTIIESARLSPSSFGLEPWKFLLLRNEKMREDFREFAWGALNSLNGATEIVILLVRKGVTGDSKYFEDNWKNLKKVSDEMFEAVKDKFTKFQERTLFDWASKQTYIALGNMMTVAAYLGIDSCAIEGFNKEHLEKYLSDMGLLDLDEYGVSVMVSFGYRDEEQPKKIRQPLTEVLEIIE